MSAAGSSGRTTWPSAPTPSSPSPGSRRPSTSRRSAPGSAGGDGDSGGTRSGAPGAADGRRPAGARRIRPGRVAVHQGANRGGHAPFRESRRAGTPRLHDSTGDDAHARDRSHGPAVPRDARGMGQGREPLLSAVSGVTMGMLSGQTALVTGA